MTLQDSTLSLCSGLKASFTTRHVCRIVAEPVTVEHSIASQPQRSIKHLNCKHIELTTTWQCIASLVTLFPGLSNCVQHPPQQLLMYDWCCAASVLPRTPGVLAWLPSLWLSRGFVLRLHHQQLSLERMGGVIIRCGHTTHIPIINCTVT